MVKKNSFKESVRFTSSTISTYLIFKFISVNFLFVEKDYLENIKKLGNDFERFFNLQLQNNTIETLFYLIFAIFLNLLIFSSYWFNNPKFYDESIQTTYLKLFRYTATFTFIFFYAFRTFNSSRLFLIGFIFFLPSIFLFFRSGGVFSKIINSKITENFIYLSEDLSGESITMLKSIFLNKNKVYERQVQSNEDIYSILLKLQKNISFDFVVLNVNKFAKQTDDFILNLFNLKKPIYIYANTDQAFKSIFPLKTIVENDKTVYFINSNAQQGIELILKRISDLIISIVMIVVVSPILIFLYILIYLNDWNSPIVKIERIGKNGIPFSMYKFRTMKPNSHLLRENLLESNQRKGPLFKIENDPRIIKKFNWIRNYSFDELPQLFNVLKGDMSLVGPRPLFSDDLKLFKQEETIRLCVMPGITGLLQINDRETDDFGKWFYWDKKYIDNWSLLLDLKILIKTLPRLKKSM